MQLVHQPAIQQMEGLFSKLGSIKKETALEVGCGDCLVSKDFLRHHFAIIDILDQDALKEMKAFKESCDKVRNIFHTPMQDFTC